MADADAPMECLPADLAPGDTRALELNTTGFDVARICSRHDPLFDSAYARLWTEFGAQHEMESRDVIARRLDWHPAAALEHCWLRYEMFLVRRRDSFVAVRDHTAIVTRRSGTARAVVHLSHVLIDPAWRRTGLAGWLRAWPLQTARACLAAARLPTDSPITLVAEMEHPAPPFPNRLIRLTSYEKAGFKKIDPAAAPYFQPDFRAPEAIDAAGGPQPLPFALLLRRLGREREESISGTEVRELVECLYWMYGANFREQDMAAAWQTLRQYPRPGAEVRLVPPTQ